MSNTTATTPTHDQSCSWFSPCESCSVIVSYAEEARHEYNKALEILEELGSRPWVIQATGVETSDFWAVFEALRKLRDDADRKIPRGDY